MAKINKRLWENRRFRINQLTEESIHEIFSDNEYKDYDVCMSLQIFPEVDSLNSFKEFYSFGYTVKEVIKLLKEQVRENFWNENPKNPKNLKGIL